jgi:type 1 fimbriae regulatory protein FimB
LDAFSNEQILELLRTARAARERDYVMILMTFLHGLRASEVVALTRDDIADGFLNIRSLKGSNNAHQMLFVNPEPLLNERDVVERFIVGLAGEQKLFPIHRQHFWRIVRKHGKAANIPEHLCHPHTLRHSIAHQLVGKTDINVVQRHMRHKSLGSTGEYLKVNDSAASAAVQGALTGKPRV